MIGASWSLQRADHGEQPYWAVILLAAALGQIGLPGGGFGFGYGSAAGIAEPPLAFGPPAMEVMANPLGQAIPAARIADCLLHPGESYDYNGKRRPIPTSAWSIGPAAIRSTITRTSTSCARAWQRPETIIVHEPWWTATARHADIVLPATTTLERNDIGAAHRDSFVIAMQQAIAPVGEARSDYAIFAELARRLGCEAAYTQGRDENAWLRHLYGRWRDKLRTNQAAIPDFDGFWKDGFLEIPAAADDYVMFADFRADPDQHRLATPSGKIELYSEKIAGFGYDDCPPHATWLEPPNGSAAAARAPIRCISFRASRATGCTARWMAARSARSGKVAGREAVAINPADAAARGIADGDVVRVHNARGACLAGAMLTDAVSPGVVRLSCGAWYDPADAGEAPLRARQRQYAHLRPRHLEARPGAELRHRAGRDRALERRRAAGASLRPARDGRGRGLMRNPELIDDLVAANRILADHGVLDAYGHISARDPTTRIATGSRAAWRPRWSRPTTSSSSTSTTIRSAPARTGSFSSA